jgi:hypothetical protein
MLSTKASDVFLVATLLFHQNKKLSGKEGTRKGCAVLVTTMSVESGACR